VIQPIVLVVFAVTVLAGPAVSLARASIVVNTTADEVAPGGGKCSLREAVAAANAPGAPSANCPGALIGGTTTIELEPRTYDLTLGSELEITTSETAVAIKGTSSDPTQTSIVADTAAHARALMVDAGVHASLSDLTVTGGLTATEAESGGHAGSGLAGGGIYNTGTLTLTDSTISGNGAGGGGEGRAASGGSGGGGGGIYNTGTGTLTLDDSTLSDNEAGGGGSALAMSGDSGGSGGYGGGIDNVAGVVTLADTTLSANRAGPGGDVLLDDEGSGGGGVGGGGLASLVGVVTLAGTTIAGNTAGEGGLGGAHSNGRR
jgi:CSLREA domain-containing protein